MPSRPEGQPDRVMARTDNGMTPIHVAAEEGHLEVLQLLLEHGAVAAIIKAMTDKFGYKNHMEVPRLAKITLNMGVGEAVSVAGPRHAVARRQREDPEAARLRGCG